MAEQIAYKAPSGIVHGPTFPPILLDLSNATPRCDTHFSLTQYYVTHDDLLTAPPAISSPMLQFSEAEEVLMESRLEEFRAATVAGRKLFLRTFARKLYHKDMPDDVWALRKRLIKAWFVSRNVKRRTRRHFGMVQRLTFKDVLTDLRRPEITNLAQARANSTESKKFLPYWQGIVTEIMNGLTEEEKKGIEAERQRRLTQGLSREQRERNRKKRLKAHIDKFIQSLWDWMGVICHIVVAFKEVNLVTVTSYDNNHLLLGPGAMKLQDVNPRVVGEMEDAFTHLAISRFGAGDLNLPLLNNRRKGGRVPLPFLPFDGHWARLPPRAEWPKTAALLRDLVRAFLMWHYHKAANRAEGSVPWTAISNALSMYIESKFLPEDADGINWSHVDKFDRAVCEALLGHWLDRYTEYGASQMFQFKNYVGPQQKPTPACYEVSILDDSIGCKFREHGVRLSSASTSSRATPIPPPSTSTSSRTTPVPPPSTSTSSRTTPVPPSSNSTSVRESPAPPSRATSIHSTPEPPAQPTTPARSRPPTPPPHSPWSDDDLPFEDALPS
ncbi:hypothetical protein BDN72DRAFT_905447, partial [Pluteus cervinus]